MRFLIAGSSGFLGTMLRDHLTEQGHEVTPLVRRPPQPGEEQWDPYGAPLDRAVVDRVIPSIVGAAGFVATGLITAPAAAMIALSVAAVGDYGTRGPFWALPGKFLSGSSAAAAIALINSMGAVGGFVGPYAVGYLKDATGSFTSPLFLLAGVLFAGSVMTLFLRRSPTLRDSSATTPANVT